MKILKKKFFIFQILAFFIIFFVAYLISLSSVYAACTQHGYCTNCWSGPSGCTYSSFSGSYRCVCNADGVTVLYCDKGVCESCTPPGCPTGYTTTNTGCSTTTTSCTRYDCSGSCGVTYRTCYKSLYRVTYDSNGGNCSPSYRDICYLGTSSGPSCSRTGYTLTSFTRTVGSGGTLNTSTGTVTSVSGVQTIRANWTINQYTVTFDGNGGSCTPSSEQVNYGSNSSVPSCTRTGYHTIGFTRTAGGGGTLNTTTGQVTSVTGTQTIEPTWELSNQPPTDPTSLQTDGSTNPSNVTNINPEFSAIYNDPDAGDIAASYQIQVNTQSDFNGTSMWDSGKTSISVNQGSRSSNITYNGTALTYNGDTYYWRIKFWDDSDAEGSWSSNSSTASFTMAVPTATYYEIEVNTQNDFNGTVMWDSGKTSMTPTTAGQRSPEFTYAGTALTGGVTYYWRIRFWDMVDNVSDWSATATFEINRDPSAPTNLFTEGETNPSKVYDTTPEFTAVYDDIDTGDTADNYQIQVNTASDFSGTTMWDSTKTSMTPTNEGNRSQDISYAGSALTAGETYYWRIKFWDNNDHESPWSTTASFLMSGPPTATELLILGTENPETTYFDIYFSAIYTDPNSDNSTDYEIEVNTASDFSGTTIWDSNKTSATITSGNRSSNIYYNGDPLNYDGSTYYVRMRFWDIDDNVSDWVTGQFTDTLKRFQLDGLQMDGIQLN
jgi:hypothetical protein